MPELTTEEKYAQTDVVKFWQKLSQQGLQHCEQEMAARYFPPRGRLLDAGCGSGRAVLALSELGYQVVGLDLSRHMLSAGRSLSSEARLSGANIKSLPFADGSFAAVFMFFGALQHIQGRKHRRRALAELARITQPGGRFVLGLDNVAPALMCYLYWLGRKMWPGKQTAVNPLQRKTTANGADATLWSRESRRVHPARWHMRGLARTLRWRTWPGLIDLTRQINPFSNGGELGDTAMAQFSIPPTPGLIYYHLYRVDEIIADAGSVGWHLLDYHSFGELNEGRPYPAAIRQRDKQLFFAFERPASA